MSAHTAAKATRLLAEGRVHPNDTLTTFEVRGDSATYSIGLECDCPAYGMCSHLEAAIAWVKASREDRAVMQAILDAKRCECMGGIAPCVPPFGSSGGCSLSDDKR